MYNENGTVNNVTGGTQNMVLYFTSETDAHVQVEIPATGWKRNYFVPANSVAESDSIPKFGNDDARLGMEGVSKKGIHITSDAPIIAYCHIYNASVSGAALLFPVNILGQDYYTLNFTQTSIDNYSYSFCFVVATEDSTEIEVTPSVNTLTHLAGVPFTQILNKGEVLNLFGQLTGQTNDSLYHGLDLTGTHIKTINNGGETCKKIAVFCGSGKVAIMCDTLGFPSSDNLIQQMFPSDAWGTKYITIPTDSMPYNFYRVMVKNPSTTVRVNGKKLTNILYNRYYEFTADTPCIITADTSILVAQYITTGQACTNRFIRNGDPEMIYLSPVDQNINSITVNSTSHYAITSHHINVVMKTSDVNSFLLDGISKSSLFKPVLSDPEYSYAVFTVKAGSHHLVSDSGFNAIVYGYGFHESYGYNAGFSIKHLFNVLSVQNPYATPRSPQTCRATPFKISVSFVYQPVKIIWSFKNNSLLSPNTDITVQNPIPDSTFYFAGKKLYRYSLPAYYNFSSTGKLPVSITVFSAIQDGCTSEQNVEYTINVMEKPVANWYSGYNKCINDTIHFFDSTITFAAKPVAWIWNFGDNTKDSIANPLKKYAALGDYNVSLRTITDIGCFGDTIKPVSLSTYPFANFKAAPDCATRPVQFTDLSTINFGAITKWQWSFGEGSVSSQQNPQKTFNNAGSYKINLTVFDKNNCSDDTTQTIKIYPFPSIAAQDYFLYEGNTIQLKPNYLGSNLKFTWSPSIYLNSDTAAYPFCTPKDDITYHLLVTGDGNCSATKDINIDVLQLLTIPNAFSPNGDGINDKWVITNLEHYQNAEVSIYNRYGQAIFHSTNYTSQPFDGTIAGKPLPVGTYYYIINTKNLHVEIKTGYVLLLR